MSDHKKPKKGRTKTFSITITGTITDDEFDEAAEAPVESGGEPFEDGVGPDSKPGCETTEYPECPPSYECPPGESEECGPDTVVDCVSEECPTQDPYLC